jgi:hypothetical protein
MTLKNILQIMTRPEWAFKTLYYGTPGFADDETLYAKRFRHETTWRIHE